MAFCLVGDVLAGFDVVRRGGASSWVATLIGVWLYSAERKIDEDNGRGGDRQRSGDNSGRDRRWLHRALDEDEAFDVVASFKQGGGGSSTVATLFPK